MPERKTWLINILTYSIFWVAPTDFFPRWGQCSLRDDMGMSLACRELCHLGVKYILGLSQVLMNCLASKLSLNWKVASLAEKKIRKCSQ